MNSADALTLFQPFRDCTETQQDELLAALVAKAKGKRERKEARSWQVIPAGGIPPAMCYKRIEQRIRALIKKRDPNDWPFVEDLETSLLSMLAQDAQGTLTLPIETPYHRLIARGVAQYYGCGSGGGRGRGVHDTAEGGARD